MFQRNWKLAFLGASSLPFCSLGRSLPSPAALGGLCCCLGEDLTPTLPILGHS